MATVRVSDALRYASKFVGLFLVVAIVAGGFIAGGAYLAADAISFSDPSLSALQETSVFIGVVLLAIGAILASIGWVALMYKFLGDAVGQALDVRNVGSTPASGEATAETDEEETTERDESAAAASTAPAQETDTAESPASGGTQSATTEEPMSAAAVDQPGQPASTSDPTATQDQADATTADDAAVQEGIDRIESESASRETVVDDGSVEESMQDEPPEWTPPDPSEFESGGSSQPTESATEDRWAGEPTDEQTMAEDEGPAGSADAGPTTEESPMDETGQSNGTSGTDPEEIDENTTLADEGVESFSTASEEDPLSDRLPGSDDN